MGVIIVYGNRGSLTETQQAGVDRLRQTQDSSLEIAVKDGVVRILNGTLYTGDEGLPALAVASEFIQKNRDVLQIEDSAVNLEVLGQSVDAHERTYVAYEQTYQGVPVLGSDIRVEVDSQKQVVSLLAGYSPALTISVQPSISSTDAEQTVSTTLESPDIMTDTMLAIYDPRVFGEPDIEPRLVWVVQAMGKEDMRTYLVDAQSNVILDSESHLWAASRREIFDAGGWPALDAYVWKEKLADEHSSRDDLTGDSLEVWDNSQRVYDYFLNTFGRESYDGRNSVVKIYLNTNLGGILGAWNPFFDLMHLEPSVVSLDIIAHEFNHGVILSSQWPRRFLWRKGEARSLNESYADVFAAFIDHEDPWRITYRDSDGLEKILRNIPEAIPNHYSNRRTNCAVDADCYYYNMAIPNFAAYLLAEGGTRSNINVTGIGRYKTQHIYYHVIQHKLIWAADFHQARQATFESCLTLLGQHEINISDCQQIINAFAAVGIGLPAEPDFSLEELLVSLQQLIREVVDDTIGDMRQRIQNWVDEMAGNVQAEIHRVLNGLYQQFQELLGTLLEWVIYTLQSLCVFGMVFVACPLVIGISLKVKRINTRF